MNLAEHIAQAANMNKYFQWFAKHMKPHIPEVPDCKILVGDLLTYRALTQHGYKEVYVYGEQEAFREAVNGYEPFTSIVYEGAITPEVMCYCRAALERHGTLIMLVTRKQKAHAESALARGGFDYPYSVGTRWFFPSQFVLVATKY